MIRKTIPPPILLAFCISLIIFGVVSMPWLQAISLVSIIIGSIVSVYAIAGLIGMAFRKKAPYLEADIKDPKVMKGIYPIVVGFFVFFASFSIFLDRLPEDLRGPLLFLGLITLFIFGIISFILAKRRWREKK